MRIQLNPGNGQCGMVGGGEGMQKAVFPKQSDRQLQKKMLPSTKHTQPREPQIWLRCIEIG